MLYIKEKYNLFWTHLVSFPNLLFIVNFMIFANPYLRLNHLQNKRLMTPGSSFTLFIHNSTLIRFICRSESIKTKRDKNFSFCALVLLLQYSRLLWQDCNYKKFTLIFKDRQKGQLQFHTWDKKCVCLRSISKNGR